ncbi:MAG: AEC family transporter [Bacillota bacterium]
MDTLIFAIEAMGPLILLGLLGYLMKQKGALDVSFIDALNRFVFTVALPVLIFTTIASVESFEYLRFDVVIFSVVMVTLITVLGYLVLIPLKMKESYKPVLHQGFHRGNFVLIGIPLAMRLGGENALQIIVIFNAFMLPITNAISILTFQLWGEKKRFDKASLKRLAYGTIVNPIMIATLLGLLAYALKPAYTAFMDTLPMVDETLDMLASTATPIALLAIGGQFQFDRVKALRKPLAIGVVGRIVVVPLMVFTGAFLMTPFIDFTHTWSSMIAIFASPIAVASVAVAKGMDHDDELASQLVIWTTLFSIVTLFILIALFRSLGYL